MLKKINIFALKTVQMGIKGLLFYAIQTTEPKPKCEMCAIYTLWGKIVTILIQ